MIEEGIRHGTTSAPSREDISKWALAAMGTLSKQIVKNAWRHGEYTWFPDEMNTNTNSNNSDH
jgi:hypothetical protein